MQRRTFLQGAASSFAAAPFGAALAQGYTPPQGDNPRGPTVILNSRFRELEAARINPFRVSQDLLQKFDLPRPPLETSPIFPFWRDTFEQRRLIYNDALDLATEVDNQTNERFQQAQVSFPTRYESSPNWSGSYVHARDGNMLLDVAAVWRIPGIGMHGGLSGAPPPACSIWVGLDGQRRYINSSLPQIGTRQQFNVGNNRTYYGWYQWWVRGQPSPTMIQTVPISLAEGDLVLCRVQASGPSSAIVSMLKLGVSPQFWWKTITPGASPFTGQLPLISGATAEWVVERPTLLGSDELYRLPRFDPVTFEACAAEESLALHLPTRLQTLRGARFIQMFERLDGPQRISMLSKPSYLPANDRDAFRVDYIG